MDCIKNCSDSEYEDDQGPGQYGIDHGRWLLQQIRKYGHGNCRDNISDADIDDFDFGLLQPSEFVDDNMDHDFWRDVQYQEEAAGIVYENDNRPNPADIDDFDFGLLEPCDYSEVSMMSSVGEDNCSFSHDFEYSTEYMRPIKNPTLAQFASGGFKI